MHVRVDGWAWIPKNELSTTQLQALKYSLKIEPKQLGDYPGDEDKGPIDLFTETDTHLGIAREYFFTHVKQKHNIDLQLSHGDTTSWPGPLTFSPAHVLRSEQTAALLTARASYRQGRLGGVIQAPSGSGKTVFACAWIAELQVPTLVVVHKDFLMSQWRERIEEYLPGAKIGIVQQDECNFAGKHIVLAMVHSLSQRKYPEALYRWPGHVVIDEVHRMGARTWAPVAPKFPVRFRTGLSATPRRKDGAENAFFYHIGPVIFKSREQRLKAKVRRVHSTFKIVKTPSFNPALAPESLLLRFLCANVPRNKKIVDLMIEAVKARRKLLVLSKRLKHLNLLDQMLKHAWPPEAGPLPTVGYYVGGMKEEARDKSATAQVIFATSQFAAEGLDIPALDTLFLVCPMGDVEQACGRVLRSYDGKKDPIVVDIRDDFVPMFKALGSARDRLYDRIC